jgi:outer membrane protein assembly factor BamA
VPAAVLIVIFLLAPAPGLAAVQTPPEVLAEIRVHGNVLTPDDEIRRLAGIETGMAVTPDLPEQVAGRLRDADRFVSVEVLKRFASIADPSQIVLVIVVDEGPVKVDWGTPDRPPTVERRAGLGLMWLPLLNYEDGYGFTYGAQFARPDIAGKGTRLSIPLTWGGDKRASVSLEKRFEGGVLSRLEGGASVSRRENPFYEENDDRQRIWLRAERAIGPSLRAGGTAGWQDVSFGAGDDRFGELGADLTFDTRLDPLLPRNAVYARAGIEHLNFSDAVAITRIDLEGRGYVGLVGQSVLVLRALRQDANGPQRDYLKPLLGGMSNLRGFKAGTAAGDTLVAGSIEVRLPLTSPLSVGKLGVSGFVDAATVYDEGERLGDQRFERGVGGSVWLSLAILRLELAVAHGIGSSTRAHFATGVSF